MIYVSYCFGERMLKKYIVLLLAILLICPVIFSQDNNNTYWDGFIKIHLDKPEFDLNENITGTLTVNNLENYPLLGGKVILNIAQGEYSYPSEFNKSNIVYESTIDSIWSLPIYSNVINFSLPSQASGEYRVDAYFEVGKSALSGSNNTLLGAVWKNFSVKGTDKKRVIIDREKTFFGEYNVGQRGFSVNSEESVSGKVVVKNESSERKTNLELLISFCDWDVSYCNTETKANKFTIDSIEANEEKEIQVDLIAPSKASQYEINLKITSGEFIESIYKNQVNVNGETAKIKKIFMTGLENNDYSFNALIIGNTTQTNSTLNNFITKLVLFRENSIVEELTENIGTMSNDELIKKNFKINSRDFDKVCLTIEKGTELIDEECFNVNLIELTKAHEIRFPNFVNVVYNYDEKNETLSITLKKNVINSRVRIISKSEVLFEEEVLEQSNIYSKSISLPKVTAQLVVDDWDAKRQQVFDLVLDETVDVRETSEVTLETNQYICQENLCTEGFTCSGKSYEAIGGICCLSECVPESKIGNSELVLPLIFFIAIIILIIAVFVIRSTIKRVKK